MADLPYPSMEKSTTLNARSLLPLYCILYLAWSWNSLRSKSTSSFGASAPKRVLSSLSFQSKMAKGLEAKQLPVWYNCCRKAGMNGMLGRKTTGGQHTSICHHQHLHRPKFCSLSKGNRKPQGCLLLQQKETYTRMKTIRSWYLEREHALGK